MALIHKEFSKSDIVKKNVFKMLNLKTGIKYLGTTLLQLPYPNISDIMHFHLSTAINKSIYEKLWVRHHDIFDSTCRHKFREITDVTDWYIRLYSLAIGNFVPTRMHKLGTMISIKNVEYFDKLIHSSYKIVCLNDDSTLSASDFESVTNNIRSTFEKKFPNQSKFEI